MKSIDKFLTTVMNKLADYVGKSYVFATFFALAIIWFIASAFMDYDSWFDIMDIFVFLITFFLLFILQASQNADTQAIQDKLDEIIDTLPKASKNKEGEEKRLKRGDSK